MTDHSTARQQWVGSRDTSSKAEVPQDAIDQLETARSILISTFASHRSWVALCQLDARESRGEWLEAIHAGRLRATLIAELLKEVPAFSAYQRIGHALAIMRDARVAQIPLEHFPPKWEPVRRKQMRQNIDLEREAVPVGSESALSAVPPFASPFEPRSGLAGNPGLSQLDLNRAQMTTALVRATSAVPAVIDPDLATVIAKIRSYRPPEPTVERTGTPPTDHTIGSAVSVSSQATTPMPALKATPDQAQPAAVAPAAIDEAAEKLEPAPQEPIHAQANARLDVLERELEALAERPMGATSPMDGSVQPADTLTAPELTPQEEAERHATTELQPEPQHQTEHEATHRPEPLLATGQWIEPVAHATPEPQLEPEPAPVLAEPVPLPLQAPAPKDVIFKQRPALDETPKPARLVALIPKLATTLPVLEADVEIVSTPTLRVYHAPNLLPAPAASSAPILRTFDVEEASISIVSER